MKNGEKGSDKPVKAPKRIGDIFPEGHIKGGGLSIEDYIDKDIKIIAVRDEKDGRGILKHITVTIEDGDNTVEFMINKRRVMDKVLACKASLPLIGKITKGTRYYDIT